MIPTARQSSTASWTMQPPPMSSPGSKFLTVWWRKWVPPHLHVEVVQNRFQSGPIFLLISYWSIGSWYDLLENIVIICTPWCELVGEKSKLWCLSSPFLRVIINRVYPDGVVWLVRLTIVVFYFSTSCKFEFILSCLATENLTGFALSPKDKICPPFFRDLRILVYLEGDETPLS